MSKSKTVGDFRKCSRCMEILPLEKFSILKKYGHHCSCKSCNSKSAKESYKRNKAEIIHKKRIDRKLNPQKYATQYAANPECYKNTAKRQRIKYPEKNRARKLVTNAIAKGLLIKQPCKYCNSIHKVEAHHLDYTKPLDVEWICKPHHLAWHRLFQVEG